MTVVKLSGREAEVLFWSARGKTAWEIATILGLSKRTIEYHIASATKKLHASNQTHAVAKAIIEGLIAPIVSYKVLGLRSMALDFFIGLIS